MIVVLNDMAVMNVKEECAYEFDIMNLNLNLKSLFCAR